MKKKIMGIVTFLFVGVFFIWSKNEISTLAAISEKEAPEPTSVPKQVELFSEKIENIEGETSGEVTSVTVYTDNVSDEIMSVLKAPEPTPILKMQVEENERICTTVSVVEVEEQSSTIRALSSDYTVKTYTCTRTITERVDTFLDRKIAVIKTNYTVYDYGDKVHLKAVGHTCTYQASDVSVEINYGYIINTDGSISYTSGDRLKITYSSGTIEVYNIDAEFVPGDVNFICELLL